MQIIIVGCGKVGSALAAELSGDENNITVIDIDPERVKVVTSRYDDEAIAEENYFDAQPDVELPIGSAYVPDAEEKEATVVEGRKMTFYERNKEAIDGLFERGEREKTLEGLLPKTKWVKLSYDEGRHYVVGVIGETPDYICYGLPAIYSATPPVGLGGYTQWLPLDVKSPHGRGYWVLYQSAVSGETVRRRPL